MITKRWTQELRGAKNEGTQQAIYRESKFPALFHTLLIYVNVFKVFPKPPAQCNYLPLPSRPSDQLTRNVIVYRGTAEHSLSSITGSNYDEKAQLLNQAWSLSSPRKWSQKNFFACRHQMFVACIAFKVPWRVTPSSFHGVTSSSSLSRRLSLVFGVCRLSSLFSRRSSSSSLFLWGVWLQRSFNIHGMCCFLSFRGVYRACFYSASCCMVCVISLNYVPLNISEPSVVAGLAIGILFFRNLGYFGETLFARFLSPFVFLKTSLFPFQ